MTEKEYWYWLCNIKGIGSVKIQKLIQAFKSPKYIFNIEEKHLVKTGCITERETKILISSKDDIEKRRNEYHSLSSKGIQFITLDDNEYPNRLRNLYDKPMGLYVKGKLPDDDRTYVAIIGARKCTHYGREMAEYFGKTLSRAGIGIISGMALGVDGASQRGALLAGGDTYGVLGCGVDICYPKENINLYMDIQKNGGLLSEFAIKTEPYPSNFPMRNRIISGLSDAIIVVEAREKSGSFITVDMALEQGKEIFALPGKVTDPLSLGCNHLIKLGANILTSPEDLLEYLGFNYENKLGNFEKSNLVLANDEKMIYSYLDLQPKHLETIVDKSGLPLGVCITALLNLELRGYIVQTSINYYAIKL